MARWYDPQIAHFVQPDSIIPEAGSSKGYDRYGYVNNCPINKNDPTGHCPICVTIVAGALIGAAFSYGSQVAANISSGGFSAEAFTNVDGASVAVAALTGAVAGATGFAVGAAVGLVGGTGLAATVVGGAVSGVAAGQAGRATTNVLTGQEIGKGLFNPKDMLVDATVGGLSAGIGYEIGALSKGTGRYEEVGGHHIQQKAAYNGTPNYNVDDGLSVSQGFMKQNGWSHNDMNVAQRVLQDDLFKSGTPNTIPNQTRIAYQTLRAGGAGRFDSFYLSMWSRYDLFRQGVSSPYRIPWH